MQQLVSSYTSILNEKLFRTGPTSAESWRTYLGSFQMPCRPALHPVAVKVVRLERPRRMHWSNDWLASSVWDWKTQPRPRELQDLSEDFSYPACAQVRMTLWTPTDKDAWIAAATGLISDEARDAAESDTRLSSPIMKVAGDSFTPKAVTAQQFLSSFYQALAKLQKRLKRHGQVASKVDCTFLRWKTAEMGSDGCLELSSPRWDFTSLDQ